MKSILIALMLVLSTVTFAKDINPSVTFERGNFFPITTQFNETLLNNFTETVLLHDKAEPLKLYFDSPGGSVFAVTRMIGILKSSGIETTCVARFAASAAFMLFQNCTNRYLLSDGVLMSHNWAGGFRDEGPRIKTMFTVIDNIVTNIEKPIAKRMKLDFKEYKRLINNNLWMDITLAKKYNSIDAVIENVSCSISLIRQRIKIGNRAYKSGCPLLTKVYFKNTRNDEEY